MTKQYAVLTVGGKTFEMRKGIEINTGVRTGFLIGGSGSTANAMLSDLIDDGNPFNDSTDQGMRAGIHLDEGGGVRQVQIEFETYRGNSDTFGGAGGADAFTQADELIHAIETTETDSRHPASLEYGDYDGGTYGPISVVFEEPMMTLSSNEFGIAQGSLTCLKTADLNQALDAMKRLG